MNSVFQKLRFWITVRKQGIKPDPGKTEAILDAPVSKNVTELKSFLCLWGYFSKFFPHYVDLVEPLGALTRKNVKWLLADVEQSQAFDRLKAVLLRESGLTCFKLEVPDIFNDRCKFRGFGSCFNAETE